MHSYHSYDFVFLWASPHLGQLIQSFRIRNEWTRFGYVHSQSYDPVECLAEVMQSEIYPSLLQTVSAS